MPYSLYLIYDIFGGVFWVGTDDSGRVLSRPLDPKYQSAHSLRDPRRHICVAASCDFQHRKRSSRRKGILSHGFKFGRSFLI